MKQVLSLVFLLLLSPLVTAEMVIVVAKKDTMTFENLDKNQVERIFLGKVKSDDEGDKIYPVYFKQGHKQRKAFNQQFLNMSESQLATYWSRLRFTGKAQTIKQVATVKQLKSLLKNNVGLIAYVDKKFVDKKVMRVIYQ